MSSRAGGPRTTAADRSRGLEPCNDRARYVVGIDLGTTNSVVACADTASPGLGIEVVAIPQVVGVRANDA